MHFLKQPSRFWLLTALGFCALLLSGCAGLRLPRIDPTGERIFVRPQDRVPTTNPFTPPLASNPLAQPIYTDPVFPRPALPATPPGGVVPAAAQIPVPTIPQDTLSLTPERVLAPVGSEVILRAGICNTDGYLLTHQRMDWMIARNDAGEFVSVGGRGWLRRPLLPWNQAVKVDNQYATGYTAAAPLKITRGTADPNDDVQIEPGEAWASITSAVEGTSHVTAVTPAIETWSQRKAAATIYWVDVAWTFPPPIVPGNTQPQVLTTTVRRQTDGTPLEGWIVRYEVADGNGALRGGGSSQEVEVTTGADGRATIEVTPTDGVGGTTRINTQLVRPANLAGSKMPRLIIGNGTSTIQWTDSPTPYLSPEPATPVPTYPIPGTQPTTPPTTPPITSRQPRLELEIHGQPDAEVNGETRFEIVIHNRGDAEATGIVLTDRFDEGLSHLKDRDRRLEIKNTRIGNLAAGASRSIFMSFNVLRTGRLCHNVRVTCREGSQAARQACVNAAQPLPQKQPQMDVRKDGPRQHVVGETALFTIVVKNTGETPLTNIQIVDEYDRTLRAQPVERGYEVINGRFVWQIPRLDVGQSKRIDVQCECLQATRNACGLVKVTADTGTALGALIRSDDHCVDVIPRRDGAATPPAQNGAGNLRLSITSFNPTVRAGQRATYQVRVENVGNTDDEKLWVRVVFPAQMTPDLSQVQAPPNVAVNPQGNEIRFGPIATIRPGEPLQFTIPVNVNQTGSVSIGAEIVSQGMPQGVQAVETIEIISR